jgi:RHH-type proline utilization regulon transcriptional repressor/proline dehydrogenase/delta 1-pyrroline-5-carboxylate dehydrogenase
VFASISPWNFPLAIFTGLAAAPLAAGNAVVTKPAGQTPLIGALAIDLMHRAGIPKAVVQLAPGSGRIVGEALTTHPLLAGVVFTGSTFPRRPLRAVSSLPRCMK